MVRFTYIGLRTSPVEMIISRITHRMPSPVDTSIAGSQQRSNRRFARAAVMAQSATAEAALDVAKVSAFFRHRLLPCCSCCQCNKP